MTVSPAIVEPIATEEQNMPPPRDPRWILLAENGDYSILGRHREPTDADIERAENALGSAGLAGWLAVMSHSVHARTAPEFVMVRPLRDPQTRFEEAVEAFRRRHSNH